MVYVIQVLSAILIGIAIGAILGARNPMRLGTSVLAIVLGLVTIFTGSWIYLAIGTVIFLIGAGMRTGEGARA